MKLYGYAGLSTDDQTQHRRLEEGRCKAAFKGDGVSNAATMRPALLRFTGDSPVDRSAPPVVPPCYSGG